MAVFLSEEDVECIGMVSFPPSVVSTCIYRSLLRREVCTALDISFRGGLLFLTFAS